MAIDRRTLVEESDTVVGIDFVEVDPTTQKVLTVYFIGSPRSSTGKFGDPPHGLGGPGNVLIESTSSSSTVPTVEIDHVSWGLDLAGREIFRIWTVTPGDFSYYTLTLVDEVSPSRIDPYYNSVRFRFQAGCRSDLDCAEEEESCAPVTEPDVAIDYTARDFGSFRRALLEFASLRWPAWKDRLEADVGVMLLELMSALGDELAYGQDRIARESSLRTATQRRSLRQHARLLDYEIQDGLTAWTWIRVEVLTVDTALHSLPSGTVVRTPTITASGSSEAIGEQICFEIGRGLMDQPADGSIKNWELYYAWNEIAVQIWDDEATCLPAGSTSIDVIGQWKTVAPIISDAGDQWILIQTSPDTPPADSDDESDSVQRRAVVVRVTGSEEIWDPLMSGGAGGWVTRLSWEDEEATPWPMDLSYTRVSANIAPAMAGRTVPDTGETPVIYSIGEVPAGAPDGTVRAIERTGPDGSVCYLLPLDETEDDLLCFVGESAETAVPDLQVFIVDSEGDFFSDDWSWRRSMVGSPSAQPEDEVYTLDDGLWGTVSHYWRGGEEIKFSDYRTGSGFTVRFGDGSLGSIPTEGTLFKVVYRVGCGASYNVGANVLTEIEGAYTEEFGVTNPLAVTSGVDPQTAEEIRQLAPEAWKALAYRAVRPEDYAEALERLDWVQKGGASLRWTGSWLTLLATVDPSDTTTISTERRQEAEQQLDRFRQAGREAHLLDPVYAWLDMRVVVCVEPSCYRGDVKTRVLEALFDEGGFFDPDQFTFGDPLIRSALYAAIQAVPGVRAVESCHVRRRGQFRWRALDSVLKVGVNEILGLCNDPVHPERGTLTLRMEGGA